MILTHAANGFIFLAWISGAGTFISWVVASYAEHHEKWIIGIAIFFTLTFMVTGFLAASLR